MTDSTIVTLVSILGVAASFLLHLILKDRAAKAEGVLQLGVKVAYAVASEVSVRTANTVDDKISLALKTLSEFLEGQGHSLSGTDAAKATALFKAMHAEQVVAGVIPAVPAPAPAALPEKV